MASRELSPSITGATPIEALPPKMSLAALTTEPWVAHQGWADKWISHDERKHPHWCEVTGPGLLSINGHFGIGVAHLIASAPDLLAAARAVNTSAVQIAENDFAISGQALAGLLAAIAKATGQSALTSQASGEE